MMDKNISSATDGELLELLGGRLRDLRKARKLTVTEVARLAGLNRTTVHRAEVGDNPTLMTLVRLLRVYGRLPAIEDFLPPPEISPMELVRQQRKRSRG
jgi:transcriptional regulator with XRE-family HTH domain